MNKYYIPAPRNGAKKIPCSTQGRWFRQVIEAVEAGLEEIGTECSKSEFDFKKPEDVDTSIDTTIFVEKQSIGSEVYGMGNYEDRLADRLGLVKKSNEEPQTPPPTE